MEIEVRSFYEYGNCRDGFNHFGYLLINGELACKSKCHYINRTWESYDGQSVRKLACHNWMEARKSNILEGVKYELGLKRATKKAREIAAQRVAEDGVLAAVKLHYDRL